MKARNNSLFDLHVYILIHVYIHIWRHNITQNLQFWPKYVKLVVLRVFWEVTRGLCVMAGVFIISSVYNFYHTPTLIQFWYRRKWKTENTLRCCTRPPPSWRGGLGSKCTAQYIYIKYNPEYNMKYITRLYEVHYQILQFNIMQYL